MMADERADQVMFSTWRNAAWMSPYVITFFQVVKLVISKSKKAEHRISQISSMFKLIWTLICGFTLVSRWWLHCFFSFLCIQTSNISNFIKGNRGKCLKKSNEKTETRTVHIRACCDSFVLHFAGMVWIYLRQWVLQISTNSESFVCFYSRTCYRVTRIF